MLGAYHIYPNKKNLHSSMVIVKQEYGKTTLPAISRFTFQYGYSKTSV